MQHRPLPEIDSVTVEQFWDRFLSAKDLPDSTPGPGDADFFGDHVDLADELLELVIRGPKRATAGAVLDFELEGTPIPTVGDRWVVCDGTGRPRAVLTTTEVRVGPFNSVDDEFAWDEGEGDRSRDDWVRGHENFFRRYLPTIGHEFRDDLPVVFERFELAYHED